MAQLDLFNQQNTDSQTTETGVEKIKIGVVGFSRNQFDKTAATQKLKTIISRLIGEKGAQSFELVSGYTASGVPKIAYLIADELGIETVGFSANQALKVKNGVYPVKKVILIGERFGDESQKFIEYIDILIRIGGGKQSRDEVALFQKLHEGEDLTRILIEEEVTWFGN
jgi:orotate phosphoribosyltransferase-like protein